MNRVPGNMLLDQLGLRLPEQAYGDGTRNPAEHPYVLSDGYFGTEEFFCRVLS